jgi:hypothetical protein
VIAAGYASGAARVALLNAGPGADPDAVGDAVRAHLDELSAVKDGNGAGFVASNLGAAMSAAQHAGRAATFADAPAGTRWAASEVNDSSECGPCAEIDTTVFDTLADALEAYPVSGYRGCQGGLRCRGILVAVPA